MRRLLAATGGGSSTPPEPPASDPRFSKLAAPDATTLAMRPDRPALATLVVAPAGSVESHTHTTISAAITAATQVQTNAGGAHPDRRVDVWVKPGTYTERVQLAPWVSLYAEPRTVTVTAATNGGLGTLDTSGEGYVEGIKFIRGPIAGEASGSEPKYGLHHVAGRTTVFTWCEFETSSPLAWGWPYAAGADCNPNSMTVFHRCVMDSHDPDVAAATNLHGWEANTAPVTMVFSECTSNSILAYSTLASGQPDEVWAVDTTAKTIRVTGDSARVHLSGNALTDAAETGAATVDTDANWPVPTGGLSDYWRTYYAP